jgi:peptidoglycan/LPS O-acetylase OafA/YrhL
MAVTAATSMIVAGTLGFGPNLHMIMFPAGIVVYELGSRFGASAACAAGSRWMDVLSLSLVSFTLFAFGLEEAQIWHIANLGALYQRVIEYLALAIAFSLLVYRCLFKQSAAYSIFSWYPLRGLGKISYSFYLLHGLILQGCFRTLNAVRPNYQLGLIGYLLLLLSLLLVAVVLTWPLFVFVESPFSLVELSTIEHAAQVRKWKRHSAAKSTEKTVDSGECRYSKGASVGPGARLQTLE